MAQWFGLSVAFNSSVNMGFLCKPPNWDGCMYQHCGYCAFATVSLGLVLLPNVSKKRDIIRSKSNSQIKFTIPFAMSKTPRGQNITASRPLLLQRLDDRLFRMREQRDTEHRRVFIFCPFCDLCPTTLRGIWVLFPKTFFLNVWKREEVTELKAILDIKTERSKAGSEPGA